MQGLSSNQKAACDKFVYIPQYGPGTASLNVAVACSIVLHHYALWAEYEERARQGEKFVVAEKEFTMRSCARGAQFICMCSCVPHSSLWRAADRCLWEQTMEYVRAKSTGADLCFMIVRAKSTAADLCFVIK
jgi:hypothetical protein